MMDDTPRAAGTDNPASRKLPEAIEAAIETLIHSTADALSANPVDDPRVEDALDAVRTAIRPSLLPLELKPELVEVLGLPNFRCGPIADVYRAAGHDIQSKSEAEQAFVLFRFLHLALRHGPGWFAESCLDLSAAVEAAKAKQPDGSGTVGDAA